MVGTVLVLGSPASSVSAMTTVLVASLVGGPADGTAVGTAVWKRLICRFIRRPMWGALFVTCQPMIGCSIASAMLPSCDVASTCCRIGMCLALTFPQPTSHWTRAPSCCGCFTLPGPATKAWLSNIGLFPTGKSFRSSDATFKCDVSLSNNWTFSLGSKLFSSASTITVTVVTVEPRGHLIG